MSIEHMAPLDAAFLHMEDGIAHMHLGSCAVFEGPSPSLDELRTMIGSRLHMIPRYRQRVQFVVGGWAHPAWVDDPSFNVQHHVHLAPAPRPVTNGALEELVGNLMSVELDRTRPLWQVWLVDGLTSGGWALIWQVHHCMVDGVSGTSLLSVLLDTTPDRGAEPDAEPAPWTPSPPPSRTHLAVDAAVRATLAPLRTLARGVAQLRDPRSWLVRATRDVTGLRSFGGRALRLAPALSIEGSIGPRRNWAAARVRLDEIAAIRATHGGTVNDVVLAAVAGALRSLLITRGDQVSAATTMHALIPVSVRSPGDTTAGNQVSLILADLPLGIEDPVERLHSVTQQMAALKASHQADAGHALAVAAELVPPALFAAAVRGAVAAMRVIPQRMLNTVVTNVPGPPVALYAMGREMLEYLPFVPLSHGLRVGVAVMSYHGRVAVGITSDPDTVPEVRSVADAVESELIKLRGRNVRRRGMAIGVPHG